MSNDGTLVMRSYDQKQEDEASWLAWALLLPREGLLISRRTKLTVLQIAERFGVTETLVNFRLRMTGVEAHLKAASHYSRK
jgi:Zn-dependent peptidase ImmA (M78 family)